MGSAPSLHHWPPLLVYDAFNGAQQQHLSHTAAAESLRGQKRRGASPRRRSGPGEEEEGALGPKTDQSGNKSNTITQNATGCVSSFRTIPPPILGAIIGVAFGGGGGSGASERL